MIMMVMLQQVLPCCQLGLGTIPKVIDSDTLAPDTHLGPQTPLCNIVQHRPQLKHYSCPNKFDPLHVPRLGIE